MCWVRGDQLLLGTVVFLTGGLPLRECGFRSLQLLDVTTQHGVSLGEHIHGVDSLFQMLTDAVLVGLKLHQLPLNGFQLRFRGIMHHRKRNTDTSPAGLWSLGLAFGNEAKPEGLNMPWRAITPNSEWVCDEESPYFNTWQERGDPTLAYTWNDDVEHLADYQTQYAYACVICYNTAPYTIPNRGCAIFLHCSTGPTGGCVGLEREDMLRVLLWLNPEENPHILITGYESGAQR